MPPKEGKMAEPKGRLIRGTEMTSNVIFVPALFAREAAFEALDAGLRLIVIITEHIPMRDTMEIRARGRLAGATIIGPNCPGVFAPDVGKLGIMPANIFRRGNIGLVGRSATLSYEVIGNLTNAGLGQTAAVGIGGVPVVCTEFTDVLHSFSRLIRPPRASRWWVRSADQPKSGLRNTSAPCVSRW
jgi:succinyl-CoA synthetase alpha subunit